MLAILATLSPVFIVIALGAVLRHLDLISDDVVKGMNWLTYWVGLPALLIVKIGQARLELSQASDVLLLHAAGIGACIVAGLLLALVLGMPRQRIGTFVQAGFRGNLAFVALPVIVFAFTDNPAMGEASRAEGLVALSLGPVIVVYNIVAVLALVGSSHQGVGTLIWRQMVVKTLMNPLVISCAVGIALSMSDVQLPGFVGRTLGVLGGFALPLALICVGGSLAATPLRGQWRDTLLASVVKLAVAPLAGYGLAVMLGLPREAMLVGVMMLAAPTAVSSYVLADQLDGDTGLASSAVVVSSILSPISFGAVLWWLA